MPYIGNSRDTNSINESAMTSRKRPSYEPSNSDHEWRPTDGQQEQQHQMDQRKPENSPEADRLFSTSTF